MALQSATSTTLWGCTPDEIKAAKRAVNAVLGNADVTDEELTTAFTGAEALLNSRPLTYQSANPGDDIPLTPNHFLIGQIGGQFAPESVDETNYSLKKRWRRVQELVGIIGSENGSQVSATEENG